MIGASMHRFCQSRHIGDGLTYSETCVSCSSARTERLFGGNDLLLWPFIDRRLKDSDYRLCQDCGLIFAARRQQQSVASLYYELFPELEDRRYKQYPPPEVYVENKKKAALPLVEQMLDQGLCYPGMRVLHLRCASGGLLEQIGREVANVELFGLDYFETNVRYVREQGIAEAAVLPAGDIDIPFAGDFDLIVANHIFTHALNPVKDLAALRSLMSARGALFCYNENDHQLIFDRNNKFFSRSEMNNYHKQLFTKPSLQKFMSRHGFNSSFLERDHHTMTLVARPERPLQGGISKTADTLDLKTECQEIRRLAAEWYIEVIGKRTKRKIKRNLPLPTGVLRFLRKKKAKTAQRTFS